MKTSPVYRILTICALLLLIGTSTGAAETGLIPNGGFEAAQAADADAPEAWSLKAGMTWESESAGNRFLRLRTQTPGESVLVYRAIPVTADQKAMEFSYRARFEDIKPGAQAWFDGRIMMNFKDGAGAALKPAPKPPTFRGTQKEWKAGKVRFAVPEGAATLEIMPALFNAKGGTLDLDDLKLVAIPLDDLPPPPAPKPPKRRVEPPATEKLPSPLHAVGNKLQDASGKDVWLQGVAIPSLEWSAGGDNVLGAVETAIDTWKANVIRLPVRDDFWFGKGPYQKDGGKGYRELVDSAVNIAAGRGAYFVLDLHRFGAPAAEHVEFWKDAAALYKDHPAVLFELFNEPHGISFDVWQNGGTAKRTRKVKEGDKTIEQAEDFQCVGMQALLDAVRSTGAKNLVIAGGLDWGYDLSEVATGRALRDAAGNGVMYSSHVYPWKRGWGQRFLTTAAQYPVFIGEVGADTRKMEFIPASAQEDPYAWVPDMLGVIQKNRLNWTGWCFHPSSTPRMVSDWDYKPTAFWGDFAKRALAGEQFEVTKQR